MIDDRKCPSEMTPRELDVAVWTEAMGNDLLTQEAMETEAKCIWEHQPTCRSFLAGFTARKGNQEEWVFEQTMPSYSTRTEFAFDAMLHLCRKMDLRYVCFGGPSPDEMHGASLFRGGTTAGALPYRALAWCLPRALCIAMVRAARGDLSFPEGKRP